MYSKTLVFLLSIAYLGILFLIAYWIEHQKRNKTNFPSQASSRYTSLVYALSMGVYCTAWTFYGSVGEAATSGLRFLSTYIGPLLTIPLWWLVLRKVIRISKIKGISTLADFISARYGKSVVIARVVTLLCVIGVVPYISIQIKAITMSVEVLTFSSSAVESSSQDTNIAFFAAILLGIFTILFTTRSLHSDNKNSGMMSAIAFESLVKLLCFLGVGVFIVYGMFDGVNDIFGKAKAQPELTKLLTVQHQKSPSEWYWYLILSALAIFLLPRQFQVAVVENENEKDVLPAMGIFAVYLLLINFLVLPIALGGKLWLGDDLLPNPSLSSDMFMLSLPLSTSSPYVALIAYIGGLSASTSMIIVSTTALSTMVSNNLLLPNWVKNLDWKNPDLRAINTIKWFRRFSIMMILFLAYAYFRFTGELSSLVSVGIVSFAAIAQFAPAFFGGLFWKRGNHKGALISICVGFGVWAYTLIFPSFVYQFDLPIFWENPDTWWYLLSPEALFGISTLDAISQSLFWSLLFNTLSYILFSILSTQSASERNEAEVFVDIFKYSKNFDEAIIWKGKAYFSEIKELLINFLGEKRASILLEHYIKRNNFDSQSTDEPVIANTRLLTQAERMLSSVVGSVSARILVSSLLHEKETVAITEVLDILKESQTVLSTNRELKQKSKELRKLTKQLEKSNQRLKDQARIKNDFISTVTHELRTPITAIRALSEIVHQNPDLEDDERQNFLENIVSECNRISNLVNEILDLDSFERKEVVVLEKKKFDLEALISKVNSIMKPLASEDKIILKSKVKSNTDSVVVMGDEKRIEQVLINLIANAIKHMKPTAVKVASASQKEQVIYFIGLEAQIYTDYFQISVSDNGKGISPENQEVIFEKFHQVRDADNRKPKGTGLGLSISKQIVEAHTVEKNATNEVVKGKIWVESQLDKGTAFKFVIPQ